MNKLSIQLLLSAIIFFCYLTTLSGQEKTLHGRVTTFDSITLVKAMVTVKSSRQVILTDTLGLFTVQCLDKDKLTVSAKGFARKNIKITYEDKFVQVNLDLKPGERNMDLAIGHDGHIKESDKVLVNTINNQEVDFSMYRNIYNAMMGRVPGVHMVNGQVIVRGMNTISSSGNEALFVLDGVIVSKFIFASIPTSDIKNIVVLKGSAASIYGSRGGNGVIEVYTKRGLHK